METYRIPAVNFPRLLDEIERMNKRAQKLGTDPVKLTVLDRVVEKKKNEVVGFEYEETYHLCKVEGEPPRLEGWTLVAVIEPVPNGENLIREVPGEVCPTQFRTTDMHCDQCGSHRKRTAIFVLKHDDGEHKQVGRQCIADFLGHKSPESLLNRAEYILDFARLARDAESEGWGSINSELVVPTTAFVTITSAVIRKLGWLPKSKAEFGERSTADIVWDICVNSEDPSVIRFMREKGIRAEASDEALATAAVKWATEIDPQSASNTYMHDLGVCCRQNYVDHRRTGYVASVLQAYQRHLAREAEKQSVGKTSKHVGELGKRQVFENLQVVLIYPYSIGIYPRTLVKFRDPQGNVIIWKASGVPEWPQLGASFTLKATVFRFDNYEGVAETEIQRPFLQLPDKE